MFGVFLTLVGCCRFPSGPAMAVEAVSITSPLPGCEANPRLAPKHAEATFSVLYGCVTEVVQLVTGHALPLLYCHR